MSGPTLEVTPGTRDSKNTKRKGVLQKAVLYLGAGYLGLVGLLSGFENYLVYIPTKFPQPVGEWDPPANVEDVQFTSADGTPLHGWYFPHPQPRAVCLFSHGNAGNLAIRTEQMLAYRDEVACSIFIYDYRGFGKSQGHPSEAGILADAQAANAWLAQRAGVPVNQIVQIGESLGGGVAVQMAAATQARGLVLIGTFTSLPDAAAFRFPFVPTQWIMRNRLDSLSTVVKYPGPLFQFHWQQDDVIPFWQGKKLHAAAPGPKEWLELPGTDHRIPPPPEFYQRLAEWVKGLPEAAPSTVGKAG